MKKSRIQKCLALGLAILMVVGTMLPHLVLPATAAAPVQETAGEEEPTETKQAEVKQTEDSRSEKESEESETETESIEPQTSGQTEAPAPKQKSSQKSKQKPTPRLAEVESNCEIVYQQEIRYPVTDGSKVKFSYDDPLHEELFVVSLEGDELVILGLKTGSGSITVERYEPDDITMAETVNMNIEVKPRDLHIKAITAESKRYDRGTEVKQFDFELEAADLAPGDTNQIDAIKTDIELQVEFAKPDSGKKIWARDFQITGPVFKNQDWENYYNLILDDAVKGQIKTKSGDMVIIGQYELVVEIKNSNKVVPYSEFDWTTYEDGLVIVPEEDIDKLLCNEEEENKEAIKEAVKGLEVRDPEIASNADIGIYPLGIKPPEGVSLDSDNKYRVSVTGENNFLLVFPAVSSAYVEIGEQSIKREFIVLDTTSEKVVEINGDIYLNANEFHLKLKPQNPDPDIYSAVYMKKGEGYTDLTRDGLTQHDVNLDKGQETLQIEICLTKGSTPVTSTMEYKLKLDWEAPKVEMYIEDQTANIAGDLGDLFFGIFGKRTLKTKIQVEDKHSGYEEWQYYIHKTNTDLDASEIGEIAERLSGSDWTTVNAAETPKIIQTMLTGRDRPGNYVVFVKAWDRVENCRIYTSTGIVIDTELPAQPKIELQGSGTGYAFRGDVTAKISVADLLQTADGSASVKSGIKQLRYEILIDDESYKIGADGRKQRITGPVPISTEGADGSSYKLEKLHNQPAVQVQLVLKAAEFESNNVKIHVIAEDRAGNLREATTSLKIDKTRPRLKIQYEDEVEKPVNDIYFNKGRKAIVEITDTNFDPNQIKFRIKREGQASRVCSLTELNTMLGIQAAWKDSQPGSDLTRTGIRTNTAEIVFRADNHYEFEAVECIDLAGNHFQETVYKNQGRAFDKANKTFVVDTRGPKITVEYFAGGQLLQVSAEKAKRIYRNTPVTVRLTIEEHNFSLSGKKLEAAVSLDAEKVNAKPGQKKPTAGSCTGILQSGSWTAQGDKRSIELDFPVDANYTFAVSYTDLAGNQASSRRGHFTVDQTAPEGSIQIGELGVWQKFFTRVRFALFTNAAQDITIKGKDYTSPVTDISYCILKNGAQIEDLEKASWKKGKSLKRRRESAFVIYGRITDKAGNITYLNSNGVILDKTSPGPAIEISTTGATNDIYSQNVPVTVRVTDPRRGQTYAGLRSVEYQIMNGGQVTQSGDFNSGLAPASKRVQNLAESITLAAGRNNSNDITVRVTATDNAGNSASVDKTLKVDVSAPKIQVTYNDIKAQNDSYYRETRVATVTIFERNFDPDGVDFRITNTDGSQPAISSFSSGRGGLTDDSAHTCTVTFEKDGDYTFTLASTDLAGNKTEYGQTDRFTIDQTVPEITVTYDNNQVKNGRYYNKARRATVKITEHNFNAAAVKAGITASLQGQPTEAPVVGSFTSSGDVHTATINFAKDGDYRFTINYQDLAGNEAQSFTQGLFTVDTTAPRVSLKDFARANKDTVVPRVVCEDVNHNSQAVAIKLVGAKGDNLELAATTEDDSQNSYIQNFKKDTSAEMDDVYTLTAKAADLAGNEKEVTAVFSLNRYGSAYQMAAGLKKMLDAYYTNSPEDVVITEMNTDTLQFTRITCSRDGQQMELEEGKHYTVAEEGDDTSWKTYTYTVHKNNFEADGKYVVTIYSEDRAANESSNQSKDKQIEFVVDKTSPSVVITGIENGGQYRTDSQTFTIDAKDNIYLKSVRLEMVEQGGQPVIREFTEEELQNDYGVVAEAVLQANKWQTVRVSAGDMAGNIYTSDEIRVLVNSNMLIQLYMNKPLFIGTILALLLLVGAVVLLIRKKRRQS